MSQDGRNCGDWETAVHPKSMQRKALDLRSADVWNQPGLGPRSYPWETCAELVDRSR